MTMTRGFVAAGGFRVGGRVVCCPHVGHAAARQRLVWNRCTADELPCLLDDGKLNASCDRLTNHEQASNCLHRAAVRPSIGRSLSWPLVGLNAFALFRVREPRVPWWIDGTVQSRHRGSPTTTNHQLDNLMIDILQFSIATHAKQKWRRNKPIPF